MFKVVFSYEDSIEDDEIVVSSLSEAYEYEDDPNFDHIESL